MKLQSIQILQTEGRMTAYLGLEIANNEQLEADDFQKAFDAMALQLESFKESAGMNGADDPVKEEDKEPAPTSTRRRNGAGNGATAGEETSSSQAGEGAKAEAPAPTTGRRGRGTAAATAPASAEPASSTASASEASASRRRRGSEAKAEPVAPKSWSDQDLSKAASEAAGKITPAKVTEIMESFDDAEGFMCDTVHRIKPEDRQAFINKLNAAEAE